jgi:hypothetical protein
VDVKDSDRLRTRLFAIEMRLAELDHEMRKTQIRVHQLESEVGDARLAHLLGEDAGTPAELGPELQRSRDSLETQRELIETVKKSRWKARVELTLERVKERRDERERLASRGEDAD